MSFNIYECLKCKRKLIAEEAENHRCKQVEKYEIKGSTLWVSDGQKWYPLNINRKFTDKKTTADYTDTSNDTLIRYWYRTIR